MNERIVMLLCSSAMTTPTCPCCGNSSVTQWPSDDYEYECDNCACLWDESVRRAQPAEAVDEAKEREAFEIVYRGAINYRYDYAGLNYKGEYANRWDGWMAAVEARARGGK